MNLVINAQLHRTQQSASLILISRCASAPRGRADLARGAARGTLARERGQGGRRGVLRVAERAGRRRPRLAGRTRRRASACPPARVFTAVSRRVQPSSPAARAAAGRLSQHLPAVSHTLLRDTGGSEGEALPPHARAHRCTLPSEPKIKIQNQKMRGGESEAGGGAQTRESPSSGGRTAAGERCQVRQSVRRRPKRSSSAGRTCIRRTRRPCGLGHDSAAGPSSHVGSPGLGWGGSADAGGEELGCGDSDGRSRAELGRCTATEGGWSPQQLPRILR